MPSRWREFGGPERENNIAELKNHHSLAELKIFGPDGAGNPNPEDAGPTQYTCT